MAEEIVQKILWTDSAKFTFNKIIEYLRREWTEREVENFVTRSEEMLSTLKSYPRCAAHQLKEKMFVLAYWISIHN